MSITFHTSVTSPRPTHTLLLRYEQRSGEIQADSPVEDIFDARSNEENEMTLEAFEECLVRDWGVTKSEMHFYFRE